MTYGIEMMNIYQIGWILFTVRFASAMHNLQWIKVQMYVDFLESVKG